MRTRILEQWLEHHGFRYPEGVAQMLIDDAAEGDTTARLFIRQAEAQHATEMFRDRVLYGLMPGRLDDFWPRSYIVGDQNQTAMP